MKKVVPALLLLSLTTLAAQAAALDPELRPFVKVDAPEVALTHVRIVDGTGGPAREDQTIVVRDGKIAAIGDAALPVPAKAQVLDLHGRTVIPGLVGMHDHLFYPTVVPSELSLEVPETFARLYLASGVTTIRTTGSMEPYTDLEFKRRVDAGGYLGPKIDVTGPFLEGPGGDDPQMHPLRDVDDARRTVDFWADQGATSFKAYKHITHDELAAAIAAAHRRGLKITGHLCSVGFREAIALGIDDLEHGPFSTDSEFVADKVRDRCPKGRASVPALLQQRVDGPGIRALIDDLVRHHVAVTSTLAVMETNVPHRPPLEARVNDALIPQLVADYLQLRVTYSDPDGAIPRAYGMKGSPYPELFKREMQFERAFVQAGGLLLAGCDPTGQGGLLAGFGDQRELELLVEAGFQPSAAIAIATANGARYLGQLEHIGTVAVGKQADLVVLHGNPIARIADVEKVELVFKDGVGYDSAKLIDSVRGVVGLR